MVTIFYSLYILELTVELSTVVYAYKPGLHRLRQEDFEYMLNNESLSQKKKERKRKEVSK